MPSDNLLTRTITYSENDLECFRSASVRPQYGVNMLCIAGTAELSTGMEHYTMGPNSQFIMLPGNMLHVENTSEDFCVRYFTFPDKLFLEAVIPLEAKYIHFLHEMPFHRHPDGSASLHSALLWLDMAREICGDGTPQPYDELSQRNFLQSFFISLCRNIPLTVDTTPASHREAIYHQFITAVRRHCAQHHDAEFYADKLCISPRYLRAVTAAVAPNKTPKQLINEQLAAEIKTLLYVSDMSVAEIADKLNFPDQSYLSRFFKRETGMSPYRFRTTCRRR